jgi:hypothetical protein
MEKRERQEQMTKKEWEAIQAAAELLGLGEKASLAEIKKAYRRLSKKHHPDVKHSGAHKEGAEKHMHELTEAYQTLLRYCGSYRFPLVPGDDEHLEGEDWWFERFGCDHHWGKGCMPNSDAEEKE